MSLFPKNGLIAGDGDLLILITGKPFSLTNIRAHMQCPNCLKRKKTTRLRIVDSRPDGPFKRHRLYRCPECKFEIWNTETLNEEKK